MSGVKALITAPVLDPDQAEDLRKKGPDYAIYDLDNPRSVINMVPQSLKEAMRGLTDEWRYLSERELHAKCKPDPVDGRLRMAFWDEYLRSQDSGEEMVVKNIVRGISSIEYWDRRVLTDPRKIAYIVVPPKDLIVSMKSLLDRGLDRLCEVLELPLTQQKSTQKGELYSVVDNALIAHMVKIVQMLDNRVQGAVIQKNLNLNVSSSTPVSSMTPEQIENRLKEIQKKIKDEKISDGEIV